MLEESDPDLRQMAELEVTRLEPEVEALENDLRVLLLPKDPNDEKNIILEIRKGAGGDEASLFAGEVFRMYTRYAEEQGWKVEVTSLSESSVGGLSEVIAMFSGKRVYSRLQVRERRASSAARSIHGNTGPRPHFHHYGGRHARSR